MVSVLTSEFIAFSANNNTFGLHTARNNIGGVVVLSSADCSSSSSSSSASSACSGHSDITDPGSPYSSPISAALRSPDEFPSSHSEESEDSPSPPAAMAPHPRSPHCISLLAESTAEEPRPPDPWQPDFCADKPSSPPLSPNTELNSSSMPTPSPCLNKRPRNASILNNNCIHPATAPKRTRTSSGNQGTISTSLNAYQPVHLLSIHQKQCFQKLGKRSSTTPTITTLQKWPLSKGAIVSESVRVGQGKITEYFKAQAKAIPSSQKMAGAFNLSGRREGKLIDIGKSGKKEVVAATAGGRCSINKYFNCVSGNAPTAKADVCDVAEEADDNDRDSTSPLEADLIKCSNCVITPPDHDFHSPLENGEKQLASEGRQKKGLSLLLDKSVKNSNGQCTSPSKTGKKCALSTSPNSKSPKKAKPSSDTEVKRTNRLSPSTETKRSNGTGGGSPVKEEVQRKRKSTAATASDQEKTNFEDEEEDWIERDCKEGHKESADLPEKGALSPILSVPRVIRFPVAQRTGKELEADPVQCRWVKCELEFDCSSKLLEHLQSHHVNSQTNGEHFVCLWLGCKVYSRASCSRSWLERHVLGHGGNKPFRCIVDGCGQRFSSQTALERHVNSHFNVTSISGNGSNGTGQRRSTDSTPNKLLRRNGKKLRYRRQPWSARMFDYIDTGIMEGIHHRLVSMTHTHMHNAPGGNSIVLSSKVMARRVELDGTAKVLVRWLPEDIMPDEWLSASEVKPHREILLSQLPFSAAADLHRSLLPSLRCANQVGRKASRKNCRKNSGPVPEKLPDDSLATTSVS